MDRVRARATADVRRTRFTVTGALDTEGSRLSGGAVGRAWPRRLGRLQGSYRPAVNHGYFHIGVLLAFRYRLTVAPVISRWARPGLPQSSAVGLAMRGQGCSVPPFE